MIAFQSKADRIFPKLSKDIDNLEIYYRKSLRRFKACLLALGNMFTPLEHEQVVFRVKSGEIVEFLKRLFMFDFKKLFKNTHISAEARFLSSIISEMLNSTMNFSRKFFDATETSLLPYGDIISCMLANFGYHIKETFLFGSITSYYDCIKCWIESCGPSCGLYKFSSSFLINLLEDIKPLRNNLVSVWMSFL